MESKTRQTTFRGLRMTMRRMQCPPRAVAPGEGTLSDEDEEIQEVAAYVVAAQQR